jgi:hypothetical protein
MRFHLAMGLLATGLAGACSLTTDLGGLSTTDATDASPEAGSSRDASGDGEASVVAEGGSDSSADAGLCGQAHDLCATFDEGALADGWTSSRADAKGVIERSTARAASAPASFHATLAERGAGDLEYALLTKSLAGAWKRTVIDFDMLLDPPAWKAGDINASFIAVDFRDANGSQFSVYFPIGDGYAQVTAPSLNLQLDPVPLGTFFHVHLDIVAGTSVTAVIAGKTYSGATAPLAGTGTSVVLDLGITGYNAPVPALSVYYDNVVVDRL